jgi:hypothetical protein
MGRAGGNFTPAKQACRYDSRIVKYQQFVAAQQLGEF